MSRNRFDNLEPERQQRLYESAADEFAAHGYEAASLNRILEHSGMSKSSLYYYFNDKADLFSTVIERAVVFLLKEVGGLDVASLNAENYWSELEEFYRRSIVAANTHTWYVKLGRAFYRLRANSRANNPVHALMHAAHHWVETVVNRGQELGVVRTDLPRSMLVDAIMGMGEALDYWMVAHWDEFDADERIKIVEMQMGMVRRLASA